jgi:hypothetical protein
MGLFDLFSNDTAERARDMANAGATAGYGQLSDLYGQGRGALTSNYGDAKNLYTGLINSTGAGAKAYGDVSGANGVEGLQRGTDLFKNSGQYGVYGVGLDEGLKALNRTHAAAGNLASGNADTDSIRYAQDQASKAYGQFAAGLQPYLGANSSAVNGAAAVDTGLGTALNTSYTNQGNAANTTQTTIGNNNASAELNNYKVGANQFNALMGVGSLAMGGLGGAGGLGGLTGGFGGTGFAMGPTSVGGAPVSGGLFSMFQ